MGLTLAAEVRPRWGMLGLFIFMANPYTSRRVDHRGVEVHEKRPLGAL